MDNKDVEMEDAEKRDSGNDIKETDDKVSDFNIELKKDEPPYAVTVAEDANKSGNGDDSSNKLSSVSEMESQTNCVGETHEPVSVEGVEQTGEKIDTESKNEGGISIGADAEVQAAAESIVDEITGLKNGVVNESYANDALKEEDPVGNDDEEAEYAANANEDKVVNDELKQQGNEVVFAGPVTDGNTKSVETVTRHEGNDSSIPNTHEVSTPNSIDRYMPTNMGSHSRESDKTFCSQATQMPECDDGMPEDQAAFIRELESFYRERATDFKPPKFYGQPLNCLKLWRAVIRLGGYDRVTGSKLWRQVGESFHPPK